MENKLAIEKYSYNSKLTIGRRVYPFMVERYLRIKLIQNEQILLSTTRHIKLVIMIGNIVITRLKGIKMKVHAITSQEIQKVTLADSLS